MKVVLLLPLLVSLVSAADTSIGGEIRERYELVRNSRWGEGPQDDNGYLLQRYRLWADARFTPLVQGRLELKSGLVDGRTGGPRPTDRDELDLHQAYLELGADGLALRVGRQELAYGSSRLVSFRAGPNVRQAFDGARLRLKRGAWQTDAFAVAPVETDPGVFDDGWERGQAFWGVYGVGPLPGVNGGNLDAYYLGFRSTDAVFDQGAGREERHTVGVRVWGRAGGWDYNHEIAGQTGEFGAGRIAAWTIATDTGYTWTAARGRPRLSLKADIASGDRDPRDADLQTFNPLFPRGAYFNESGIIGPFNLVDLHPQLELQPHERVTLSVDANWFWRESRGDGVYGPGGNVLRSGEESRARRVGTQTSIKAEWRLARGWKLNAVYARFDAGPFLRESGAGETTHFVAASATYAF